MKLVLIRGLPGSGKSTLAMKYKEQGYDHFEADMFFVDEHGKYNYVADKVPDAHAWCLESTKKSLAEGRKVVVSNTFVKLWEMEPYKKLGVEVEVITTTNEWQNTHNVPKEVIERMKAGWQEL